MTYNPKSQKVVKLPSYHFSYRRFNPEKLWVDIACTKTRWGFGKYELISNLTV